MSLIELHTNGKFGTVVMYIYNSEIKQIISVLCWYNIFHVVKENKHSLLTLLVWFVWSFCVVKNKECSLPTFHIWLVRLFMSRTITNWVYWCSIWLVQLFVSWKAMRYCYSWLVWLFMSRRIMMLLNLLHWPLHAVKRVTDREAKETK